MCGSLWRSADDSENEEAEEMVLYQVLYQVLAGSQNNTAQNSAGEMNAGITEKEMVRQYKWMVRLH